MSARPKNETEAMQIAFEALRGQDRDIETRMMLWLSHRLREHRRGQEAAAYKGPEPSEWRFQGDGQDEYGCYNTRDEGFDEIDVGPWGIVEITGHAAVHQEFVVVVPVADGDPEDPDISYEYQTFATRELAEKYAAEMQASGDPA